MSSPDLDAFLDLLCKPLPKYTCARLTDGRVAPLVKDCSCITHEGPHWLHADQSWGLANRRLFTDHPNEISVLTFQAFAQEEASRLQAKRAAMENAAIAQLLTDEPVPSP